MESKASEEQLQIASTESESALVVSSDEVFLARLGYKQEVS